jgi:uncharacterized protein YxjI
MLKLQQFFIKERVGMFKLSNAYDIIDPETGKKVGLAQEKVPGWVIFLRFLVNKQMLPTSVDIIDNPDEKGNGKIIVSIKRGMTFLRSKVKVLIEGEKEIGYFKSKLFSFGGGFIIYDVKDTKVAEIKGDWKGWNFKLSDTSGREIGTITKKWSGLGKEMFTSADNYMISIPDSGKSDAGVKALLLAAGIAIDTVFKEK